MSGYIIFKKNGKIFKQGTKTDIENYFNGSIIILEEYLTGKAQKSEDNW
jgi:hypothetical protein